MVGVAGAMWEEMESGRWAGPGPGGRGLLGDEKGHRFHFWCKGKLLEVFQQGTDVI